jgi:hypothetical protein
MRGYQLRNRPQHSKLEAGKGSESWLVQQFSEMLLIKSN